METGTFFVGTRWESDTSPISRLDHLRVVATGPSLPPSAAALHHLPYRSPPSYEMEFADQHLVADAAVAGPWPQIADVLIVRDALPWRADLRSAFPGRLVTAFSGPDQEHSLEVATGWLARLVPLPAGIGDGLWPYASFVHSWTTAGRSLDALHDAQLTAGPPAERRGVRIIVVGHSTAWRVAA
jgi:hypothetical protein